MASSRFLAKIPNTKVLRDFLVNSGGYYVPPIKDLTNNFCRVKTYIFIIDYYIFRNCLQVRKSFLKQNKLDGWIKFQIGRSLVPKIYGQMLKKTLK